MFRVSHKKAFSLAALFIVCVMGSKGQQKGAFETNISFRAETRAMACFVPSSYRDSELHPLIIGMHPGDRTPAHVMRDMMRPAAERLKALLVCPQDFQYDGEIIPPAVEWAKNNYRIDPRAVVVTGYSAGGNQAFRYAFENPDVVRGVIGIAPSVDGEMLDNRVTRGIPVAMICGRIDGAISLCEAIKSGIERSGGPVKLIAKQGVGHTGPYFYSPEFTADWVQCFKFIIRFKPKPKPVILASRVNRG